ncbi:MAG: hypothetical protein K2Q23_14205 [Bryobacteraceae bacterium]|nr:hypothetical protein [Bryobacteraceae bacterium]
MRRTKPGDLSVEDQEEQVQPGASPPDPDRVTRRDALEQEERETGEG